MFSIDTCMFKISIHLSSQIWRQKIRICIKRTVLIWVFFERKGNLNMCFSLEMWVQILAHIRNQKKRWHFVSHHQFCMAYPNRKKKKLKLLGSMAGPQRWHLGCSRQSWAAGANSGSAAGNAPLPQWSRQCWEYQSLTSTEGSNPSCAREGS